MPDKPVTTTLRTLHPAYHGDGQLRDDCGAIVGVVDDGSMTDDAVVLSVRGQITDDADNGNRGTVALSLAEAEADELERWLADARVTSRERRQRAQAQRTQTIA